MAGFRVWMGRVLAVIVACSIMFWIMESDTSAAPGSSYNFAKQNAAAFGKFRKSVEGQVGACPSVESKSAPAQQDSGEVIHRSALSAMVQGAHRVKSPIQRRHCIIGPFHDDWKHFEYLIRVSRTPFAVVRYGDGERMLMQGKQISQSTQAGSVDKFWWDGGDSELGKDLIWSLTGHYNQEYYYGFASPIDDADGLIWFLNATEQTCNFITYANLWVNSHYVWTKGLLDFLFSTDLQRVVLIANYEGLRRFKELNPTFPTAQSLELPDDAAHIWNGNVRKWLIGNSTALARAHNEMVFVVSGGPLAKVLISYMWAANPSNQYIDFGSSTDEILKGRRTRPYMDGNTHYAKQVDPPFWVSERFVSGSIGLDTAYDHRKERRLRSIQVEEDDDASLSAEMEIVAVTDNSTLLASELRGEEGTVVRFQNKLDEAA